MLKTYFLELNNFKKTFTFEEIYNKVSTYRKGKVDRLQFEKDKWLSLGAEYLFMKGLKELNIDYSKIEIEHIERNKPIFKNYPKNLYYNLSHSGNMAMCVISDKNIGCDIQEITEKENILELAKRFFHPDEFKIVQNAQENERLDYFFRIWALKESYIKNTGKGLGTSLRDFKICIDNNLKFYINDVLNENYIFEEIQTGNSKYKSAICINKY